jgi:hypothetical protein
MRLAEALSGEARLLRKLNRPAEAKPLDARANSLMAAQGRHGHNSYTVDATELSLRAR